jgi:hypothetical protein
MATAKPKQLLIEYELKFLEKKLKELKEYISATPFSTLKDRETISFTIETKEGLKTSWRTVATKEAQRKDLTQALKDYAEILRTVDAMRVAEEGKAPPAVRGDEKLGSQAARFLANRDKK